MKKILVVIPFHEQQKIEVAKIAPKLQVIYKDGQTATAEEILDANIIIGNVDPTILKESKKLEWIQLNSAGADAYIQPGVLPEGVKLTNASGAYGLAISEHMLGAALCLKKKLYLYQDNMKKHRWMDEGKVTSIWNSTVLVVGMGDIGSEFAKRIHMLGGKVLGIRKHRTEKPEYLQGLYQMEALPELLPQADIVALTLPGTKELTKFFGKEEFAAMKKDGIFINVGRGSLVDEKALCEALISGEIAGAAIDVTAVEPLPEDSPLWDCPNLILTPHISGQYHLPETLERIKKISMNNLKAFVNEEPLCNEVDFQSGYRSFHQNRV